MEGGGSSLQCRAAIVFQSTNVLRNFYNLSGSPDSVR